MEDRNSDSGPAVRRTFPSAAASLLAIIACAAPISAQQVHFEPRAHDPVDRRLADFLAAGDYEIWARDTILSREEGVLGNVLVLGAVARIAGVIQGSVFAVDGDVILRPGAALHGELVVLGGGLYSSKLAAVDGETLLRAAEEYRVLPAGTDYRIELIPGPPATLNLHGLYGLEMPWYERVDAVTLIWGIDGQLNTIAWNPSLELVARLTTRNGAFEGTAKQFWHPRRDLHFGVVAERITRTRDRWIRGILSNSVNYFLIGDDFANYYKANRVLFNVGRSPLSSFAPSIDVQWERASSQNAEPFFVLFADDDRVRPNPSIDPGDIWSVVVRTAFNHRTTHSRFGAEVSLEGADSSVAGDFSFLLGEASVAWESGAFLDHSLELYGIVRGDLSGALPRQRWSAIGGRGTLPSVPVLALAGPRLAYGEATYLIPITPLELTLVGPPWIFLRGAAGSAWGEGSDADFTGNLILGLRWWGGEVYLAADPADFEPRLYLDFVIRRRI